jgi:hypothetical protein
MQSNFKELSSDIKKLYESGYAFIHIFEIGSEEYGKIPNNEAFLNRFIPYYDREFIETGEYIFKSLPCSSVRSGFSMRLFESASNIGIMLDARDCDILYTAPNIIYNSSVAFGLGQVYIRNLSIFESTDNIQKLEEAGFKLNENGYCVPSSTSPEKNARCLAAIDEAWKQMEQAGKDLYYQLSSKPDSLNPMVTETLLNMKNVNNIKAVILNSPPEYDSYDTLFALVVKGVLIKQYGVDVPLIYYEKKKEKDFSEPFMAEMVLDKHKVKEVIENTYRVTCDKNFLSNIEIALEAGSVVMKNSIVGDISNVKELKKQVKQTQFK